jgi:hypothetical protein
MTLKAQIYKVFSISKQASSSTEKRTKRLTFHIGNFNIRASVLCKYAILLANSACVANYTCVKQCAVTQICFSERGSQ